ncbi:hypothetical protein ACHAWF_016489 [Thalassiosira exigua]
MTTNYNSITPGFPGLRDLTGPSFIPVQPGFQAGMMIQSRALWAGNEIYFPYNNMTTEYYCAQAMFWPEPYDFQTWQEVEAKCEDVAFDPLSGVMEGIWFGRYTYPGTVESTQQYKCLNDGELCDYNLLDNPEFSHCQVEAKACGAQLNEIWSDDTNSCDVWQINLVQCPKKSATDGDEMEAKLVQVTTYAEFDGPGFENYKCPIRPTYDSEEIVADPAADGGATFVMQASFAGEVDLYNPCNWDCFNGTWANGTSINCPNNTVTQEPAPTLAPTESVKKTERSGSGKSNKSEKSKPPNQSSKTGKSAMKVDENSHFFE